MERHTETETERGRAEERGKNRMLCEQNRATPPTVG